MKSMQNETVSVVLPIYNVEKYLNRCIESVVNQSYRNLEIILVDDGSPDGCPAVCDAWAAKDSRVRVIHKKNAGLGMARNSGIEIAGGKYICFFDSDDYIAPDAIELACAAMEESGAQIVCFGHHDVDASGNILASHRPAAPEKVYSGADVQAVFLPNLIAADPAKNENWNLNMSAWSAMYSMDLIRQSGWRFVSEREILSEDIYSLTALYRHVQRAAVLDEALYFYCRNDQSLSRVYRRDRFDRNVIFYLESLKLCDRLGYSDDVRLRLTRYMLSNTIAAMKQLARCGEPLRARVAAMRSLMRHSVWQTPLMHALPQHETRARRLLLQCILHRRALAAILLCRMKGN